MRKVLFVTPHLQPSGPARQLCLLAAALPRGPVRVCVLGRSSPWCEQLRRDGVPIDVLTRRGPFDLRALWQLRALVDRERPDIVHAWGPGAAWPLLLSGARPPRRLTVTAALPPGARPSTALGWLLRRCGRVVAVGAAEGSVYRRLGVSDERLVVLPPGVPLPAPVAPARLAALPEEACVIVVLGPILPHTGQFEAIWAADILAFVYPDLHLVLVGDGPGVARARAFVRASGRDRVGHFTGVVDDVQPWLARADVVWAPCQRDGGRMAVLEAMAAGKPVVASRLPGLEELVADGETGYLVAPQDRVGLCRLTRVLLEDAELRRRMGEAGRRRVDERFALANLTERYRDLCG